MATTLNAADAELRLRRMVQAAETPTLTDAEIDDLLTLVPQIDDSAGVAPEGTGYVPTYSIYAASFRDAAAEGWAWKAAKVAGDFDVATGNGTKFDRSQVYEMCMRQAAAYGGGSRSGARLGSLRLATQNTHLGSTDEGRPLVI